ncbi:MAG: DNA-binding response regulator [Cellvibrionaceae bacterium]
MNKDQVLLYQAGTRSDRHPLMSERFDITCVFTPEDLLSLARELTYKVVVCDLSSTQPVDLSACEQMLSDEVMGDLPLVVLASSNELSDKLAAFELGVADYLGPDIPVEEICARISKTIFHQVASEQLKDRLDSANETAFTVMSDNSDLGSNIQFLLGVNHCDNLDQLGQLFFRALGNYKVTCSLQMRSLYEVKDMEANGIAKDLESQLLFQMKDGGRYIDFGRRTVVNYGQVSLLIRDMPVDDDRRYGAIKDNTFALIQGVDARLKALDEHHKLLEEKQALQKLSLDVKTVMTNIDDSYQDVMRHIVDTVEDLADKIHRRIPSLALSEEQENFFEEVADHCVAETNKIFNQGLHVDEVFQRLSDNMDRALESLDDIDELVETGVITQEPEATGDSVELF